MNIIKVFIIIHKYKNIWKSWLKFFILKNILSDFGNDFFNSVKKDNINKIRNPFGKSKLLSARF